MQRIVALVLQVGGVVQVNNDVMIDPTPPG
jgi:hypothetical protein